jgi:hypothetical protein
MDGTYHKILRSVKGNSVPTESWGRFYTVMLSAESAGAALIGGAGIMAPKGL